VTGTEFAMSGAMSTVDVVLAYWGIVCEEFLSYIILEGWRMELVDIAEMG
jgi:hypothetical protein